MAAGTYNTAIEAERDLVRVITWVGVDLTDYNRLIYNIETTSSPPVEVLLIDSDVPAEAAWLYIDGDPDDGVIKLEVPASEVPYVWSDTGRYVHELTLYDVNGGVITLFRGRVVLLKPIAAPAVPVIPAP